MINVRTECESFITFNVDKNYFEHILQLQNERNNDRTIQTDVIINYANNVRLSDRELQYKTREKLDRVLGFDDGLYFPIVRTKSLESIIPFPTEPTYQFTQVKITSITHRLIVEKVIENECTYRLACNKIENDAYGVKYTISCEIEYPSCSTYDDIINYEISLIRRYKNELKNIITRFNIQPEDVDSINMFSHVIPKIQIWTHFNNKYNYVWALKWNGLKAKFLVSSKGFINIWPDASAIKQINIDENTFQDLKFLQHICLQIEIMDKSIIIVGVIAATFYNHTYIVEAMTNVKILNYLDTCLNDIKHKIRIYEKRLKVQTFFMCQDECQFVEFDRNENVYRKFFKPPYLTDSLKNIIGSRVCDGFIIVQNNVLIKWKEPTIDGKCVAPFTFQVGGFNGENKHLITIDPKNCIDEQDGTIRPENGGRINSIYEISSEYKILRLREDRLTCSTESEYKVFLAAVNYLNE